MARIDSLTVSLTQENNWVIHEMLPEAQYYLCFRLMLQKAAYPTMKMLMNKIIKIGLFCLK